MAGLFNSVLNRCGWHGTRPDLEFATFDDRPEGVGFHFQDDAPRRRRHDQFLSPGNTGSPPQFPRKYDPVRSVKCNRSFHGMTMSRSWRICKPCHCFNYFNAPQNPSPSKIPTVDGLVGPIDCTSVLCPGPAKRNKRTTAQKKMCSQLFAIIESPV